MGREVGGGFRMGNTCTPMADSCQRMAKTTKYCKVISLQLKLINLKNKNKQQQKKSHLVVEQFILQLLVTSVVSILIFFNC